MEINDFSIGQLAKLAHTNVQTIRFYEHKQLLDIPLRTEAGQRRYNVDSLNKLKFIRHGREMGFCLDDIKELLLLSSTRGQTCEQIDAIANAHLLRINSRIKRLQSLQTELSRMIKSCQHGEVANCRVIEVLDDHKHCGKDHGEIEKI
ncbi:MAG: helix-turn-helix domain-containing protein [Rhizobiales bacterium]|nr:helix-turn-helix domain-containing protein [Hyphomicrobiales bacterium]NRB14025.1 helix-turn-helix domain-containing protein [Hyphomicrobiales bacterium]